MSSFYTRAELQKLGVKSFGQNVLISRLSQIYHPETLEIGDNVRIDAFSLLTGRIQLGSHIHIGAYSAIFGRFGVELQDFSTISSRVSIYSVSDDYSGKTLTNPMIAESYKNLSSGKVLLEKHVIVGAHSVILPNLTLSEGTAVGAMSLIRDTTAPWSLYCGVPAVKKKNRANDLLKLERQFSTIST